MGSFSDVSLRDINEVFSERSTNNKSVDFDKLPISYCNLPILCNHILNRNNKAQNTATVEQYYGYREELSILPNFKCTN